MAHKRRGKAMNKSPQKLLGATTKAAASASRTMQAIKVVKV